MKYVCLVYLDEREPAAREALERSVALGSACPDYGGLLAVTLEPAATVTLRRRNGAVLVGADPVGPGTARLGGLLLIEARDLDRALAMAAAIPAAALGCIELRPVREARSKAPRAERPGRDPHH